MQTPIEWLEGKERAMRSWEQAKPGRERAAYYRTFTACFALVALILLLAFLFNGREPIWNIDGLEQYLPFYLYEGNWIRDAVAGFFSGNMPESFLWSWGLGYGSDTLATLDVFWDPLNLTSALVPASLGEYMFVAMVFVRMYLAGVAFSAYALYRGHGRFAVLVGAIVYSFSGPALVATFWPGGTVPLVLFPLLLLGAEKIFAHERPTLFIVAVALFLVITYYFSYAAFIFLFVYCAFRVFQVEKHVTPKIFLGWTVKFFAFLLVGAALSAVALFPQLTKLLTNDRATSAIAQVPLLYDLNYYLAAPGSLIAPTNVGSDCFSGFGGAVFVALVALFTQKKSKRLLKLAFVAMCLFMLLPFFGSFFNGMNYATNRWVWAFAFCLSYIVVCTVPQLENAKPHLRGVLVAATVVYAVVIMADPGSRTEIVMASFVGLVAVVAAVLAAPSLKRNVARFALCGTVIAAMGINAAYFGNAQESYYANTSVPIGQGYVKLTDDSPNSAVSLVDDRSYWRYDADTATTGAYNGAWTRCTNSSLVLGLNAVNYYNSIYNNSIDRLHTELGIADDCINFRYYDLDNRSALEALMGVKYFLAPDVKGENLPYNYSTLVAQKEARGMMDNVYAATDYLPIGFTYDRVISRSDYLELSQVDRQEAMLQALVVPDEVAAVDAGGEDAAADTAAGADAGTGATTVSSEGLDLTSEAVSATVASTSNAEVKDGKIIAKGAGATVTFSVAGKPNSETYLVVKNLSYKDRTPREAMIDEDYERLPWYKKAYTLAQSAGYKGVNNYMITAAADKGGQFRTITNFVPSYHMYGGKSDWSLNLGYSQEAQSTVTLTFRDAGAYTFDDLEIVCQPMDNFDSEVNALKQDTLENMEVGCDSLSGDITLDRDKYLFLSIPYSTRGWSATVDGEPVQILKANTAFMAIPLAAGHHTVKLHYMTPGLEKGACISLVGLVLFAGIMVYYRRKGPSDRHAERHRAQ